MSRLAAIACGLLLGGWMLLFPLGQPASAHIVNERNLYEDVQQMAGKDDLVFLTGIQAIVYDHSVSLFKPKEKLTRKELAHWAASFFRLKPSGTAAELAQAALQQGLVASLDGNATYADANKAFFGGAAQVDKPEQELTREAYAAFLAPYVSKPINGKSLIERAGYAPGPSGTVEAVETRGADAVYVTVSGKVYPLAMHPRVLHAAADAAQWKGLALGRSWLAADAAGGGQLLLLDFAASPSQAQQAGAAAATQPSAGAAASSAAHAGHTGGEQAHAAHAGQAKRSPPVWLLLRSGLRARASRIHAGRKT
ncbi:MAG: hypothetical protein K0Q59_1126 [Paenibacillus sp.]|nr:hypothetical protein [Paenibacillus sp.]